MCALERLEIQPTVTPRLSTASGYSRAVETPDCKFEAVTARNRQPLHAQHKLIIYCQDDWKARLVEFSIRPLIMARNLNYVVTEGEDRGIIRGLWHAEDVQHWARNPESLWRKLVADLAKGQEIGRDFTHGYDIAERQQMAHEYFQKRDNCRLWITTYPELQRLARAGILLKVSVATNVLLFDTPPDAATLQLVRDQVYHSQTPHDVYVEIPSVVMAAAAAAGPAIAAASAASGASAASASTSLSDRAGAPSLTPSTRVRPLNKRLMDDGENVVDDGPGKKRRSHRDDS